MAFTGQEEKVVKAYLTDKRLYDALVEMIDDLSVNVGAKPQAADGLGYLVGLVRREAVFAWVDVLKDTLTSYRDQGVAEELLPGGLDGPKVA